MATRGVFQLQKLRMFYCEHGGSSRAVRDYLGEGGLVEWARNHPTVEIILKPRNGKHPYVLGEYKTQAATHQICIKNSTPQDIQQVLDKLHNRSGRKIKKMVNPVVTPTPSIQGVWTPMLDLQNTTFPVRFVD
ncbi:39S ribosomal protein L43, mitochondrial [Seminavis robusta]|uniref:Large ribosomal subunit protein mL43 n=1 Tax=Seminavis robusta TaxID=568900 RepID=A0A9N8EM43_9STRA|nr:39S ribosomal protein L43, mitochondrial [Seminavis robusta]|eukprot:Sro1389_g268530.1 39S ribosomal protein L43, mitochondrial (133) ;mRNA; r:9888-10409